MELHLQAIQRREKKENHKEFTLISLSYILVSTGIEHLIKSCFLFEDKGINSDNKRVKSLGNLIKELNNLTRVQEAHREGLKDRLSILNELRNKAAHSDIKNIKSSDIRKYNCEIFDLLAGSYPKIFSDLTTPTEFPEFRKIYSNYDPRKKQS